MGLLPFLTFAVPHKLNNSSFKIPILHGCGLLHFAPGEAWMYTLLKKIPGAFDNKKCFVDVGMNVGQTLLCIKTLYPKIDYIGFEPNTVCYEYVHKLVSINRMENTHLYPVGLSDAAGILELVFYDNNIADQSASVVPHFRANEVARQNVAVLKADELGIWDSQIPGIIKIDVEGGELEVFRGFNSVLEKWRPYIICEVLPAYSSSNTARIFRHLALEKLLRNLNYSIFRISETSELIPLSAFGINDDVALSNYLFVPCELFNNMV